MFELVHLKDPLQHLDPSLGHTVMMALKIIEKKGDLEITYWSVEGKETFL